MAGKPGQMTTTQTPDAASQNYIDMMRRQAAAGVNAAVSGGPFFTGAHTQTPAQMAAQFMNPYMDQVVGGVRGEFDFLRNQAAQQAAQQATQAGAFGGSRAAVTQGARMGELDRAQASQIANLMSSGYQQALGQGLQFSELQRQLQQQKMQEPLFQQQQALNFMNLGMGPVGSQSTQTQAGGRSPLGSAASGALMGSQFGPWGALIGGGLGLASGLWG